MDKETGIDYKSIDAQKIIDYIKTSAKDVSVKDLLLNSGADELRIYPILFELEQAGCIEVVKRKLLGAPLIIRFRSHPLYFQRP